MTTPEALGLLDLSASYTEAELKRAWRMALMVWHPDRFQDDDLRAKAAAKTLRINQAFELLSSVPAHQPSHPGLSAVPPARKAWMEKCLAKFWRDQGYEVRRSTDAENLEPSPNPFASQAMELMQHGSLVAFHGGQTVNLRLLIDGDPLSDYAIAERFPEIHKIALRLRRHAGLRQKGNSGPALPIPDWWIPFRTLDTSAIVCVAFSSSKRARLFRKNFADEARHTSWLFHVYTRLAVIDLESGSISQDIARPGSGEREEFAKLHAQLFGNGPPSG